MPTRLQSGGHLEPRAAHGDRAADRRGVAVTDVRCNSAGCYRRRAGRAAEGGRPPRGARWENGFQPTSAQHRRRPSPLGTRAAILGNVLENPRVGFELSQTVEDELRARRSAALTPRPYLFVVLEGARPLAGGARYALDGIDEIHVGRGDRRAARVERAAGGGRMMLELPSPLLSRLHARLRRGPTGWTLEDAGVPQRQLPERRARLARGRRRRRSRRGRATSS